MRRKSRRSLAVTNPLISMDEYQRVARETDQNKVKRLEGLAFPLLGLFGEVGTLLSALKKKRRDTDSYPRYTDIVVEEFGDVLWYFSNIASRASLKLSLLAQRAFRELENWDQIEDRTFDNFRRIRVRKHKTGSATSVEFERALISLAGKVGLLLDNFSAGKIANNRDALSAHLIEIFRALIIAADVANVSLATAADENVKKIHSRWPISRKYPELFDAGFDPTEQLPRHIVMHIIEKRAGNKTYVIQRCNDINIGSRLTDNKIEEDDYRFHDVFHLGYAAILGWSPVIRALFKVKRKSRPEIDEAEDGARAILIEEGIATLIFNYALRLNFFESVNSLDYSLLKLVHEFVRGFEVEQCPLWQWEQAILEGFGVFRSLRKFRRGKVSVDLTKRRLSYSEL
jgi:NTP pyrophosphatase (non-canonical NTP hydrolase)